MLKRNLHRSISSMWSQVEPGVEIKDAWRKYKFGECQSLHKSRNINKMLQVVFAFIADAYLPRKYKVSWRRKNVICNSSPVKTRLQTSVNEFKLKVKSLSFANVFPLHSTWIGFDTYMNFELIYNLHPDVWLMGYATIEMLNWRENVWPMVACLFWALVVLYRMLSIFT